MNHLELDSFTEKLVERTKKREEMLESIKKNIDHKLEVNYNIRVEVPILTTPVISKDDFKENNATKLVEFNNNTPVPAVRESKAKVIGFTPSDESNIKDNANDIHQTKDSLNDLGSKGMHLRLARLAQTYRNIEDDYKPKVCEIKSPKKVTFSPLTSPLKTSNLQSSPKINRLSSPKQNTNSPKKSIIQGPLLNEDKVEQDCNANEITENDISQKESQSLKEVSQMNKSESKISINKPDFSNISYKPGNTKNLKESDPSNFPISARKTLFEKRFKNDAKNSPVASKIRLFESGAAFNSCHNEQPDAKKIRYESASTIFTDAGKAQIDDNDFSKNKSQIENEEIYEEMNEEACSPTINNSCDSCDENKISTEEGTDTFLQVNHQSFNFSSTLLNKSNSSCSSEENRNEKESSVTKIYPKLPTDEFFGQDSTSSLCSLSHQISKFSPINTLSHKRLDNYNDSVKKSNIPLRTLSMYRKEQKMKLAQLKCKEDKDDKFENEEQNHELQYEINKAKKIEFLESEILMMRKLVDQSIKALKMCIETKSLSRVEAERVLLLNERKLRAFYDEVGRLKTEKFLLIKNDKQFYCEITNLRIMVKSKFLVSQVSGVDPYNFHFACLFVCNDRVIATDCLNSSHILPEAAVCFYNQVRFDNLFEDFRIRLEVYGIALSKPGSKDKRLLNFRFSSPAKSPYKQKVKALSLTRSNQGGIRLSSEFKLLGYYTINRKNYASPQFILEGFIDDSPLEESFMATIKLVQTNCQ